MICNRRQTIGTTTITSSTPKEFNLQQLVQLILFLLAMFHGLSLSKGEPSSSFIGIDIGADLKPQIPNRKSQIDTDAI